MRYALLALVLVACDGLSLDVGSPLEGADGGAPAFPSARSYADKGPFKTMNEAGGRECRVYRPRTLGELGRRHPVILWGNGTLGFPAVYAGLFNTLASHGFIVVAASTSNAGTGVEMLACLAWITAEDARPGSAYAGRVDLARVGASGHSQGGGGSILVGRDPRVVATAPVMPYIEGLGYEPGAETMQSGPMLLLSGGRDTIARPETNQAPVFGATNVPVFWGTLKSAGHTAALANAGGFREAIVAWFRYQLMDDEAAATWFEGPDCELCTASKWTVMQRDL